MSTTERVQLLMIKGLVSEMSEQDQKAVADAKADIKAVIDRYGEHGAIALALLTAEMAAEE